MFFSRARTDHPEPEPEPEARPAAARRLRPASPVEDPEPPSTEAADREGPPPATVEASLGAVGYAMFALLRPGPLEDVPTFAELLDRPARGPVVAGRAEPAADDDQVFGRSDPDDQLAAVARPAEVADLVPGVPQRPIAAGRPIDEDVPLGPGGLPAPTISPRPLQVAEASVEPEEADEPEQPEEPEERGASHDLEPRVEPAAAGSAPHGADVVPLGAPPEPGPRTSNTLAMLQEISFLDD